MLGMKRKRKTDKDGEYKKAEPDRFRTLRFALIYPIEKPVYFEFDVEEEIASVGHVVFAVCQAYRYLYRNPGAHGVRWHGMGDLFFERILVHKTKNIIQVGIGS